MLVKTHFAIVTFFILALIGAVEQKFSFVVITLIATLLPDADSKFSKLGRKRSFRPLQFFVNHRGILHSFTFLILASIFFALFIPVVVLPFFLGYGVHLLADSFTVNGIKPFYPLKKTSSGKVRTGGKSETSVFVAFVLADLFLFMARVSSFI